MFRVATTMPRDRRDLAAGLRDRTPVGAAGRRNLRIGPRCGAVERQDPVLEDRARSIRCRACPDAGPLA